MVADLEATAGQPAFLDQLLDAGLLIETEADGLYGRGAAFERVLAGLDHAISEIASGDVVESLRYPPLLTRYQLERNGYLGSFPHLAGTVFSFAGKDLAAAEQEAKAARHEDWSAYQSMTDVVLAPAACYPVYPEIAKRGALPGVGLIVDTGAAWVFRNEPSRDPARMRSFRMREFVRIADPDAILAFRNLWLDRVIAFFDRLGLVTQSEIATDPFFGRAGRMLAANQREQELKFELVAPIALATPTAIASFNYHQDHFTLVYGLGFDGGGAAHTGCVAFGMERIVLALFRAHGLDPERWPPAVRSELWA